ncbi:glutamate--cysteine ligase [Thiothrix subterranea]|uniref:glutamate--cysteine ligase n=1 Tax=Thiothrix subterranea TaxID=2735563 RepID=UPI00192B6F76|nr:glutamate--cysteine ligase [Thiothrix subterranea]QQZ27857.1 glutamate--cysteine ligase [Thiothrix subterranea]
MNPFRFGIEHEVAFYRADGKFADFTNTGFEDFQQIVDRLPEHPADAEHLRSGDAGIRRKRWYIEGYERFNEDGTLRTCTPKGIEIRTTIHTSIQSALNELQDSYTLLLEMAARYGYRPAPVSFNPEQVKFTPNPPLNAFEREQQRNESPEERDTAHIPMLTYGPDLSLSQLGMNSAVMVDAASKLTYYSPFIVPFSFNSPFYAGEIWSGLSIRTWKRTGARPAALVFPPDSGHLLHSNPTLTKAPRHPAEAGRIEFKAFDSSSDFTLYGALFALLKGLVLDDSLPGRAIVPNAHQHQMAAMQAFDNPLIFKFAWQALHAADRALGNDPDHQLLEPLFDMLQRKRTPAHELLEMRLCA